MWVLSRLVAFVAVAYMTWQFGLPGLLFGAVFLIVLPWLVRLRRIRQRATSSPPSEPLRWRPKVRLYGLTSGLMWAFGGALLLQQYQVTLFDTPQLLRALVVGIATGVLIPSVVWWFVVRKHNRRLVAFGDVGRGPGGTGRQLSKVSSTMLRLVAAVGAMLVVTGPLAMPAMAELSGPCQLTVNGNDVNARNRADVIQVGEDDALSFVFDTPGSIAHGSFGLYFAGLPIWAASGDADTDQPDPGPTSESGAIPAATLMLMGTGLYEARLDLSFQDGSSCAGGFVFGLPGDPLEHPIGAAAATIAVMGVAGLVAGAAREAAEALGALSELEPAHHAGDGQEGAFVDEELHGQAALDALREAGRRTVEVDGQVYVAAQGADLPGIGLEASAGDATTTVEVDGEQIEVYRPDAGVSVIRATEPPGGPAPAGIETAPTDASAPSPVAPSPSRMPADVGPPQPPEPITDHAPSPPPAERPAGPDGAEHLGLDGVSGPPPPPLPITPVAAPAASAAASVNIDSSPTDVTDRAAEDVGDDESAAAVPNGTIPTGPDAAIPEQTLPATGADDFMGSGVTRWLSDTAQTLSDAKDQLEGWVDDLFEGSEAEQIKQGLQTEQIGDTLASIKDVSDTYTRFVDVGTETIDTLEQWGVPPRMQEAVLWVRWVAEGSGRAVQAFADAAATPMMEPIAQLTGGDAGEYAQTWLPVGGTAQEASDAMMSAVKYVRGGEDRVSQIQDNRDLLSDLYTFP